CLQDTQLPHTF
nr:immunoglobulin light chain junction region [Macaca mulatta]